MRLDGVAAHAAATNGTLPARAAPAERPTIDHSVRVVAVTVDAEPLRAAGVEVSGGGVDTEHNRVHLTVTLADRETLAWFESTYPADMIVVDGWFRSVG